MDSALNIAISGFNAASLVSQTVANNLANAQSTQTQNADGTVSNTPYQPETVQQASLANGGVEAKTAAASGPASISEFDPTNAAANAQGVTQEPNVDEGQQFVNQQIATYTQQGTLAVIKSEEKNQQALLNIIS